MAVTPKPLTLTQRFAKNLRNVRGETPQAALAKKLGLSTSYVSMLERGVRHPPLNMVDLIARKMKIDPLDLLKA